MVEIKVKVKVEVGIRVKVGCRFRLVGKVKVLDMEGEFSVLEVDRREVL